MSTLVTIARALLTDFLFLCWATVRPILQACDTVLVTPYFRHTPADSGAIETPALLPKSVHTPRSL